MVTITDDADILDARHVEGLHFVRVIQDRRVFYRLVTAAGDGRLVTDARHARETLDEWKTRGKLAPADVRLPGDVGAVRDLEVTDAPIADVPRASGDDFTLTGGSIEAGRKQGGLF